MPRENRKRGKKHKKQNDAEVEPPAKESPTFEQTEQEAGPSWIVGKSTYGEHDDAFKDAPFGLVDPDLKAYFRTVDAKLREWQELSGQDVTEQEDSGDPNEERRVFVSAVLQELSGKEQQLATDPDCSIILERMAYSMDDFVKRVFMDRLAGSYEQLSTHRFGSHVVQTLLLLSKGSLLREMNGAFATENMDGEGKLPLMSDLIMSISEELLPNLSMLCKDQFASHVLRALFVVLCPKIPSAAGESATILRSKKSAKHRAKQGPMKSVFSEEQAPSEEGKGKSRMTDGYPVQFDDMARRFIKTMSEELDDNETRALAADKAAAPLLVLLLEMESLYDLSREQNSIMDRILAGLITASGSIDDKAISESDYVTTLLREPTASHVMETIVRSVPQAAFNNLWEIYFEAKIKKLAVHPVANFIVARAIERLTGEQLRNAVQTMKNVWPSSIKNARTGVIKACIDRAVQTLSDDGDLFSAILEAFGLCTEDSSNYLVKCTLYLKNRNEVSADRSFEPSIQGSLLLQSLLMTHDPHIGIVAECITNLPISDLLSYAQHPVSSRIFDAFLESTTVPYRYRRKLILAFVDHFHTLVDDRVGSRVGERLWAAADPYLKEKIARTLIPYETTLVASRYGKFFVRGLNLYLLKRDAEEWKARQAKSRLDRNSSTEVPNHTKTQTPISAQPRPADLVASLPEKRTKEQRKRKGEPQDIIDSIFSPENRQKKAKKSTAFDGELQSTQSTNVIPSKEPGSKTDITSTDKDLDGVLSAIRNAPKEVTKPKANTKKRKI